MAELQHSQIRAKLLEGVVPHVDNSDIKNHPPAQLEAHALSRALALTAARMASDADLDVLSKSLVDGGDDNGLDLIHYDSATRTLFLVQSKWSAAHASSIAAGEVLKFLQGVQDLVSLKKERFNERIKQRWPTIEDALKRLTSVRVVVAYAGSGAIDADIQSKIDDFIKSNNDTSELFFFQAFTQRDFFQYFVQEAAPPQIDLTVKLSHFGLVEESLKAVYGQVSAADVAEWCRNYGNQLFAGNIRHFLGLKSDVNSGISKTIAENPKHFWYFNNGITMIVQSYAKQAFGGNDRSVGLFDCKGVTIVNGAQTVGTIGRTLTERESPASLQARIIVVEDPESIIGKEITRASNTQNRIDARNFVALDPEQERIRTELLIEKVEYEYREGEVAETATESFEFIEAITTLACASGEISYVALAKGYVGGLYLDINTAPYRALFNNGTSSRRLWSLVRLARRIDVAIRNIQDPDSAFERGVVVHGNRLLTHCILRKIGKVADLEDSAAISDDIVEAAAAEIFGKVKAVIAEEYPDAYLAPLFKNVGKCSNIRLKVE
ncbi:AIPR family protein [Caulobacter sp. KR2-114]|uniref:AIPR family protein n=1 Tax=Caulobacter sp. KR2-114 TaxID=3400912 RepID=UPI003C029080